jgi:adenylate cyclase
MLSLWISGKGTSERFTHQGGPLELGRGPQQGAIPRKVLANPTVSANQCRLEKRSPGQLQLWNLSQRVAILLADGTRVEPLQDTLITLPARLYVGDLLIEIDDEDSTESERLVSLQSIEAPLGRKGWNRNAQATLVDQDPSPADLARWFEALVSVQKAAASSPDFFQEVARAVVELVGLDCGMILWRTDENWSLLAAFSRGPLDTKQDFSKAILDRVLRERLTFFQQELPTSSSLAGVSAVVAAPIIDDSQQVVGAVYGVREGRGARTEIHPLEAQLTQVLAATVAAGRARLESEAEAARRRVQFEQFFTSDLADELDRDPRLLDGREREITVLFADVRGFSSVSERVEPRVACDLIRDIMESLTTQARSLGAVIDYLGDGLLAMWNAPIDQHDHAARACQAAIAMRAQLPELNGRWQQRIGRNLDIGIGINSGPALVGNTGSRTKFKYGPLGHSVNLASRVEGATKHFGVGILITDRTRALVGDRFATRRLCRARVVGMAGEVELFELHSQQPNLAWESRRDSYESALSLFESKRWGEACHVLFPLLPEKHDAPGAAYDLATIALLGRTLECLRTRPTQFDPVLELTNK